MSLSFPKGFLIGTASSAYQVEGAYDEDGKGVSIWDHFVNEVNPDLEDANITADSYHKYKEDVKLLKDAGFNVYRFSISWTRILPNGELTTAGINQKGVEYYRNLIEELKKNDIEPVITMYHWDLPHNIQDGFGGWTNSLIVDFMEDYADLLFSLFGDTVKWWVTINEPTFIIHGYENGESLQLAPARNLCTPANYIVAHNILKAHARIYRLYDKKYRATQKGKVGISFVGTCFRPKNPNIEADVLATERANQFYLGLFAHPIFTKEGDYPCLVRKIVDENSAKEGRRRSRLPTFTKEEKESLIGASDFFGVNHYLTQLCSPANSIRNKIKQLFSHNVNPLESFVDDLNAKTDFLGDPEPTGFREILNYIKNNYGNPPIFVTENGTGSEEEADIEDDDRVNYFREYLKELLKAIHEDKCNVVAYTAYTLLDNFEWSRGYSYKYGIVSVDFNDEDRKRTPKKSYEFFKRLTKTGVVPEQ